MIQKVEVILCVLPRIFVKYGGSYRRRFDREELLEVTKRNIRIFAVVFAFVLLTGCGNKVQVLTENNPVPSQQTVTVPDGVLSFPYCSSDSLNPFFAESRDNAVLMPLVYMSLYTLDSSYTPLPQLVLTENVTPQTVTVTLRSDIQTPLGGIMNATDVLYSFNLAKESPCWAETLRTVENATVQNGGTAIVFTFKQANVNAKALLTFPIVKSGTAETADDLPIGSGPYSFVRTQDSVILRYNPLYGAGDCLTGEIRLVNCRTTEAKEFALATGETDCNFCDYADGNILRSSASSTEVGLNHMVYLGVNMDDELLSNQYVRQTVSLYLDRERICEYGFSAHAVPTTLPFNPVWQTLTALHPTDITVPDLQGAERAWNKQWEDENENTEDDIIYEYDENDEIIKETEPFVPDVMDVTQGKGTLELVVCDGNAFRVQTAQAVKDSLEKGGFTVNIRLTEEEAYQDAIDNRDYDLFLGEIRLTDDMSLNEIINYYGKASYGINYDYLQTDDAYAAFLSGNGTLAEFLETFTDEMPLIPLCFRTGTLHTSRDINCEILACPGNLFANIEQWYRETTSVQEVQ